MKTLVAINNLTAIDQLAYANHIQFFFRLGVFKGKENVLNPEVPVEFALCNPRRMSIDRMRNEAAKIALDGDFDYLFFIDDDVLLPFDAFHRLRNHDKDIIAGVTHIRGYPYHPMIFNFSDEAYKSNSYVTDYAERADELGLLKCDAVGFSCCLINTRLLKRVSPPYFITSTHQTEDVFFCKRVRDFNSEQEIWVDVNVKTGHLLGNDIIAPENVKEWKEFDEKRYPHLLDKPEVGRVDRKPDHMMQVIQDLKDIRSDET
jgi:hypothetical protein